MPRKANESKRILVVDDDPIQLQFAAVYLAAPSRSIATARSGKDALQKLFERDFDLLITDVAMPGMDGIELLRSVRSAGLKTRTILVTGTESLEAMNEGYRLGIETFATKPLNWKMFAGQVAAILDR